MKHNSMREKTMHILGMFFILVLAAGAAGCGGSGAVNAPPIPENEREPGASAVSPPEGLTLDDSEVSAALIESITAAGDYMVKYQLANGALSYRVDILTNERNFNPSHIRLIAGTGSLFTVCRVTGDEAYCQAGDRALAYYLERVTDGGDVFGGACFYSAGYCKIGGAALAVDAIYKRWLATGEIELNGENLLDTALELGDHMVWLRSPTGGFYHRIDPFDGAIDPDYYVTYFNGESLMALLELYQMTEDEYWLEHAHAINSYMLRQRIKQDHWHAYAFRFFAELDTLTEEDQVYAERIANAIIEYEQNLAVDHSTISTATKVEALASIALALEMAGADHEWLAPAIQAHADFMMARQLPNNLCGYRNNPEIAEFDGGIYYNCDDPYIRIDGLQHWINGAAAYLEYLGD
jgi:hypothetical protein